MCYKRNSGSNIQSKSELHPCTNSGLWVAAAIDTCKLPILVTSWNWNSAGEWKSVWVFLGLNSFSHPQPQFIILCVRMLAHCLLASTLPFNIKMLFLSPDSEFFVN